MGLATRANVSSTRLDNPDLSRRFRPSDAASPFDFDDFAEPIRRDLAPVSRLEEVLAERVVLAAWRLHLVSLDEIDSAFGKDGLAPLSRQTLRAECSLETAIALLHAARRGRQPRWGCAVHPVSNVNAPPPDESHDSADDSPLSNEWPTLPVCDDEDEEQVDGPDADGPAVPVRWQDRLVFDFNVSETSPVVKGTWVTVGHVVSLIVDGWSWSDVLRSHPELTEDDVRMCLAYTVEQDDRGEH